MLVSEFVSIVLNEIESLPKPLSGHKLMDLLNNHKDSHLDATHENLLPFIDLLRERWERIKDNEKRYNITPNSSKNRAYMIVAKHLSKTLNDNFYDNLMPNTETPDKWQSFFRQHKSLDIGGLQEYFMTDTGEVIETTDPSRYKF